MQNNLITLKIFVWMTGNTKSSVNYPIEKLQAAGNHTKLLLYKNVLSVY